MIEVSVATTTPFLFSRLTPLTVSAVLLNQLVVCMGEILVEVFFATFLRFIYL